MSIYELVGIAIATLAAGFIKGGAGMGAGIFLQPVLTLLTNPMLGLGLSGPILLFTDAGTLWAYWKNWAPWKILLPLFCGCLIGTLAGLATLPLLKPAWLKLIVGICGVVFVITKVFGGKQTEIKETSTGMLLLMTACGGFFNTVANAGGIFFAWCCIRLKLPPRAFVATLVAVIFFNSIFKVGGYLLIDTLTPLQLAGCLLLLPVALAGVRIGSAFNKTLNKKTFNGIILSIIALISTLNLISFFASL